MYIFLYTNFITQINACRKLFHVNIDIFVSLLCLKPIFCIYLSIIYRVLILFWCLKLYVMKLRIAINMLPSEIAACFLAYFPFDLVGLVKDFNWLQNIHCDYTILL